MFSPTDADPNIFEAILPVLTQDDPGNSPGTISVELVDDSNPKDYRIEGDSQANTVETEVISPPNVELSIAYEGSAIEEGQTATFVISTTTNPLRPTLDIKYTPTNSAGSDFLDPARKADGTSLNPTLGVFWNRKRPR